MTIKELACRVISGELDFGLSDHKKFLEELQSIPSIGPWTAQYISLRARGSTDAFGGRSCNQESLLRIALH